MDAVQPPIVIMNKAVEPTVAHSAEFVLQTIQRRLPATRFLAITPSSVPGLYALKMEEGKVGYTDKTGRYFIVGVIFDTLTGDALDNQLTGSNTGDSK